MAAVRISPKFQVVIPEAVRKAMGLKPGTKVEVFQYQDRIEFIPQRKIKQMRGFLQDMDTTVPRDGDRA